jgi:hypothetical protein
MPGYRTGPFSGSGLESTPRLSWTRKFRYGCRWIHIQSNGYGILMSGISATESVHRGYAKGSISVSAGALSL